MIFWDYDFWDFDFRILSFGILNFEILNVTCRIYYNSITIKSHLHKSWLCAKILNKSYTIYILSILGFKDLEKVINA